MPYTEASYENAVIELFTNNLGYQYIYGPDVDRDYQSPFYLDSLESSLQQVNKSLPAAAIQEAICKIKDLGGGVLLEKNRQFTDYLQNGVPVNYLSSGETVSTLVYLIDFENPNANDFTVANQWTFIEFSEKRPDVILFINGLPLVIVELKSPSREETDASAAYRQLRNYMHEIPSMFVYNMVCVMSDLTTSKAGTITSGEDRFMEWKTTDGNYENTAYAQFDTFFTGLFEKNRFLDILKNFVCFNVDGNNTFKILAGYHQYFAVKKAVAKAKLATKTDGKGGVFWHTQGSGKSLSMVFYAHYLQSQIESPTILVITDRNDLDAQLYGQFSRCQDFLRQTPIQAESRVHLRALLEGRQANGIIFTTMQKFMESSTALSERSNIIVMADEAHRGQYGLNETIDIKTNEQGEISVKTKVGIARIIRDCLPNATFIGFTGTPISSKDRSTREVFGDYIDIYDMTQAVEDGATKPVFYESRVINLKLNSDTLELIDKEYELLAQKADDYVIEKSKRELTKLDAILGAEETINSLVTDILNHYENYRENLLTGKAMIVAYSRQIAMKIYKRILALRPNWTDKVGVVMTQGNDDPEEWREVIGNKAHKDSLARKFKDNNSEMKIAIVVDMWLTGFDVPSLSTMYIYKAMAGHNLMQAIARVNRVFKDKEGGLIVDYIGIAQALKHAMKDYTKRDTVKFGNNDISSTALAKFLEILTICRDMLHGFDYHYFYAGSDLEKAKCISMGANFIIGKNILQHDLPEKEQIQYLFIKHASLLKQALSLCSSIVDEKTRAEAAYFEALRIMLVRLTTGGGGEKLNLSEINARINELLKQSIKSEGVINLFNNIGSEFSLFDPKFLEEIAQMEVKNLAIELLRKLIEEQVSIYRRSNVVQSEKFSEKIQQTMNKYLNGMLTNEEVIQELLKLAKELASAHEKGEKLGLNTEELAFYDALTKPAAIKDFYDNEELVEITRKLTELLRENRTIDWQKKESARANMRRLVKRLLKKYKYPPEGIENAIQTVIAQCEMWTDNVMDV